MTDSNPVQPTVERDPLEAACQREAARIRQEREGWVVVWLPHESCYRAYPKFRAPRGTVASAAQPEELLAQMDQVELRSPAKSTGERETARAAVHQNQRCE
jgi:hypothetical protein